MKTAIAMLVFGSALTVSTLPAAQHVCIKDGLRTASAGKKACEKMGGRWETLATPKRQAPKRKGSK